MITTETKVEELKGILEATAEAEAEIASLERLKFRLSDAIREGASVTEHSNDGWGAGERACALHGAVISARARGYIA